MKQLLTILGLTGLFFTLTVKAAEQTHRIPELDNDRVVAWQTVIYPSQAQILPMHRHDRERVVVALTDGSLRITTDKGESRIWMLEQGKAYFLGKDVANELHSDVNITDHPIKVVIIELKDEVASR